MSVILLKIKNQTGEAIFPATLRGNSSGDEVRVEQLSTHPNRQFEFQERGQLFIRTHNVTLCAIAAIMVSIVRSIGGYKPPSPIPETQSAYHLRAR